MLTPPFAVAFCRVHSISATRAMVAASRGSARSCSAVTVSRIHAKVNGFSSMSPALFLATAIFSNNALDSALFFVHRSVATRESTQVAELEIEIESFFLPLKCR